MNGFDVVVIGSRSSAAHGHGADSHRIEEQT